MTQSVLMKAQLVDREMLPTGFKERREPCTKGSKHAQSWKGKEANFSLQSLEGILP